MLPTDLDDIATPLPSVEPERERQPRFRADRVVSFEGGDFVLAPRVVTVRFRHFEADAPSRITADQLAGFGPADEMPEAHKPVACDIRRHGIEQRCDELPR
jgi:hypothetical protein